MPRCSLWCCRSEARWAGCGLCYPAPKSTAVVLLIGVTAAGAKTLPNDFTLLSKVKGTVRYHFKDHEWCTTADSFVEQAKKREAAAKAAASAAKALEDKTVPLMKQKGKLDEDRAKLEMRAVALRMRLSTLAADAQTTKQMTDGILQRREQAVTQARRSQGDTRRTQSALRLLNRSILALRESAADAAEAEARAEAATTRMSDQVFSTYKKAGEVRVSTTAAEMELNMALNNQEESVQAITERLDSLEAAVLQLSEAANKSTARVAIVRSRLADAAGEHSDLERKIGMFDRTMAAKEAELDRANENKRKAQQLVEELHSQEEEARRTADSAQQLSAMQLQEKEDLTAALAQATAEFEATTASVGRLSAERDMILRRMQELVNVTADMRSEEQQLAAVHAVLKVNASVVSEQLAALKGRLSAALMLTSQSEHEAEHDKMVAERESGLANSASHAILKLDHQATLRHLGHVEAMARGALGDCGCSGDEGACEKCGPAAAEAAAEAGNASLLPPSAEDVLGDGSAAEEPDMPSAADALQAVEEGDVEGRGGADMTAIAQASAEAQLANALTGPQGDGQRVPGDDKTDREALTVAAKMIRSTNDVLEKARDAVVDAAEAHAEAEGASAADQQAANTLVAGALAQPSLEGGKDVGSVSGAQGEAEHAAKEQQAADAASEGKTEGAAAADAASMSTSDAIALADNTASAAAASRADAEGAIDAAVGRAAGQAATDAAAEEDEAHSAAAKQAEEEPVAAGSGGVEAEEGSNLLRFRASRGMLRASGMTQATLQAGSAAQANTTKANITDAPGPYKWTAQCQKYDKATDRNNKAVRELAKAENAKGSAQSKLQRMTEQLAVSKTKYTSARDVVNMLAERVAEEETNARIAQARMSKLETEIEKISASVGEAQAGIDAMTSRVAEMEYEKDSAAQQASVERKARDRAEAQQQRSSAALMREEEALEQAQTTQREVVSRLRDRIIALKADHDAKAARVQELLSKQSSSAKQISDAEEAEEEARTTLADTEREVDSAQRIADERAEHVSALETEVAMSKEDTIKAEAQAEKERKGILAYEEAKAGAKSESRALRGALQQAKAGVQSTAARHSLTDSEEFSLNIALRQLRDRLDSREGEATSLKHHVQNLATEAQAYQHTIETGDSAIAKMGEEAAKAEARERAAKEIAAEAEAEAAKAEAATKQKEADLDVRSLARGMAPPGTLQDLQQSAERRAELERLVGGSHAAGAQELVDKPYQSSPPGEQTTEEEVVIRAALDLAPPVAVPAAPAQEAEVEDEPAPTPTDAQESAAAQDEAELDEKANDAVVRPEDLQGATGDASTDALLGDDEAADRAAKEATEGADGEQTTPAADEGGAAPAVGGSGSGDSGSGDVLGSTDSSDSASGGGSEGLGGGLEDEESE